MGAITSVGGLVIPIVVVRSGDKRALKQLNLELKSIIATTKQANADMLKTAKGTKNAEKGFKSLNKQLNVVRWGFVNLMFAGTMMAGLALPIIALTKYGMELETTYNRIGIVTGSAINSVSKSVKSLKEDTMFSLQEIGGAMLEFTKQGFSMADAMYAVTPITQLATVGFTDLNTATKIVAQTMHEFNLEAKEAGHIADVIAAAANASAADVETFGVAMSYAGPIANQAGLSFEETAAGLSILSNMGLAASKSGTSFAAALTMMIKPTDKVRKEMGKLGIEFFDSEGDMKSLDRIITELSASLGGLTDEQRLRFLTQTFGRRGARAIAGFLTSVEGGSGTIASFTDEISQQDYVMEQMVKVHETSAGRLKIAWTDMTASFAGWGEGFNNTLSSVLESYNKGQFEEKLAKLSEFSKEMGMESFIPLSTTKQASDLSTFEKAFGLIKENINIFRMGSKEVSLAVSYELGTPGGFSEEEIERMLPVDRMTALQNMYKNIQFYKIESSIVSLVSSHGELAKAGKYSATSTIEGFSNSEKAMRYLKEAGITNMGELAEFLRTVPMELSGMDVSELKTIEEIMRAYAGYQENIHSLEDDMQSIGKQIVAIWEDGNITQKQITDSLGDNEELFKKIIDGSVKWEDITIEQKLQFLEIHGTLKGINDEVIRTVNLTKAAVGMAKELSEKYRLEGMSGEEKTIQGYINDLEDLQEAYYKAGLVAKGMIIGETVSGLESNIEEVRTLHSELETAENNIELWTDAVDRNNEEISVAKDLLAVYKKELSGVNELLGELSKPRFEGQLKVERMMSQAELYMKKQELATYGIVDAHKFLQDALKKSDGGYGNLLTTMNKVNDATKDNKKDYEAWRENVQEFIDDTIKSGNKLGENVSGAIAKYSAMLRNTSKYNDKQDEQVQLVELLRTAYDVHYGAMEEDVKHAIQVHDEEGQHMYSSSAEVITALEEQWLEHKKVTASISEQEDVIDGLIGTLSDATGGFDSLTASLVDSESQLDTYKDELDDITDSLKDMEDQALETATALTKLVIPQEPEAESKGYSMAETPRESGWYADLKVGTGPLDEILKGGNRQSFLPEEFAKGGIVNRPTLALIGEAGPEAVVPLSPKNTGRLSGSMGTTVTIGNIQITGASGDPEDFARRFKDEIERVMVT